MKNEKGQSTIEFIMTFTMSVGFIFLFLKSAINFTNGYMVQHAIFFAGRAYLVHDAQVGSRDDETERDTKAKAHAQEIFENYLPPGLIKGLPATLKILDPENSTVKVFIGPYIDFEQEFSMGFIGGKDKVKYRAEAFLGREPTRFETYKQICDVFKEITTPSNCETAVTLDDNGG